MEALSLFEILAGSASVLSLLISVVTLQKVVKITKILRIEDTKAMTFQNVKNGFFVSQKNKIK